jgi:hypothetical protein
VEAKDLGIGQASREAGRLGPPRPFIYGQGPGPPPGPNQGSKLPTYPG